jgi:hypothetical protein
VDSVGGGHEPAAVRHDYARGPVERVEAQAVGPGPLDHRVAGFRPGDVVPQRDRPVRVVGPVELPVDEDRVAGVDRVGSRVDRQPVVVTGRIGTPGHRARGRDQGGAGEQGDETQPPRA